MYICLCYAVTDKHIGQAVSEGATCFKDIRTNLGVGKQCGRCRNCAHDCLKENLLAAEQQINESPKPVIGTTMTLERAAY